MLTGLGKLVSGFVNNLTPRQASKERERFLDVRFDVTDFCNLRCRMCYFSMDTPTDNHKICMSPRLFEGIVKQVGPISTQVFLSCGAEPLVHPRFREILRIARKHASRICFVTNGQLFDENLARYCVDLPVDMVIFSIDGDNAETYEWVRRGASFETLKKNVKAFAEIRKGAESMLPTLGGHVVLMKKNMRELPELVRLCKELGFDFFDAEYLRLFKGLWMSEQSLEDEPQLAKECMQLAVDAASEVNLNISLPYDLASERCDLHSVCRRPWNFIYISATGEVKPCDSWFSEIPIGDFKTQSFYEIWDGPAYSRLRRSIESGEGLPACCVSCHSYQGKQVGKDIFKEIELGY